MRNSLAPQMPNVTLPPINMGHTPLDAQKRIKQLLIMMTPDEQSIIRMAQSLIEDIRAHNLGAFVGQTLLHCVKCLPQKSMMLVGLFASLRNQSRQQGDQDDKLARAFLDELAVEFDIACKQSRWAELRLLLRFTVGLGQANVVELSTIWSIIEKVRSWIDMDDLPSSKREYLLHTLLTLVPFLVSSPDQPSTEFDKFNALKKDLAECVRKLPTTELLNVRISKDRSIAPSTLPSDSYSNLPFSFSLLSCWVSSLQDLATPIEFLHDPSEVSVQRACYLAFKNSKIPPISWHGADHLSLPATAPPRLRPIFRLFPRSPSSQSSSPSSSAPVFPLNDLLVGEYISDILIAFEALHKEGVKQLLSLPLPLSDDARTIGQYLVIETIFEAMLTLPTSSVKQVYYGTIIIDLFKAQPNLMPPLLGAGFNFLFHHLQFLDREIIERLLDWFSFHLSNFGYAWPWVSWNYVLEQSDSNPQRSFVREALGLCVRLSYWERIQQVIPEEFLVLMPPQPSPAFRFSTKNIQNTSNGDLNIQQYYQFSLELIAIMNGKATPNAIIQWLDQNVAPALGSEARVRLFTPCLLECGNKSYSHSIALLDRYKSVFQTLTTTTTKRKTNAKEGEPSDESPQLMPAFDVQRLILHSIAEYWQHSLQHLIVLLDQFFIYNILTIDSLLGWCFFSHRHAHNYTHLWQPIFYPHLRISLDKFTSELDLIREKPRAMTLTQEKRIEDEAKMEEIKLEQRDLISMVISNFQKLYQEEVNQSNRATREKDKQRYEFEQANVIARFKQFVRQVS